MTTDKNWESWGHKDPYFGVLSDDRYRKQQLSEDRRTEFFASGESYIAELLESIRRHFSHDFTPKSALDFGCGVGRLLIPLARHCQHAIGVDISLAMLAETKINCDAAGLSHVDLVLSDDDLSKVNGFQDLVHSCIVLQHIHPRRGYRIVEALATKVNPEGFLAIQFPIECRASSLKRFMVRASYAFPLLHKMRNLARGRPYDDPEMQLHTYDLRHIRRILDSCEFDSILLQGDSSVAKEFSSVRLIAQRRAR